MDPLRCATALAAALLAGGCGDAPVAAPTDVEPTAAGWSAAERLAAGTLATDLYGGRYPPGVDVGLDAAGRGWAVWAEHSPPRVQAARYDGGWRTAITTHDATRPLDGFVGRDANDATIAVNRAGEAMAAWTESHPLWVGMAQRWTGAGWEPAIRVQDEPTGGYATRGRGTGNPGGPAVFLDEEGNSWALWSRSAGAVYPQPPAPPTLRASFRPAGGSWSAEATVVDESAFESYYGAALLARAELLVAWPYRGVLRSARLSPRRNWATGVIAGAGARRAFPALAPLADGSALVSWTEEVATPAVSSRPVLTRVGIELDTDAPVVLSPAGGPAQIAVSRTGAVFAAWLEGWTVWARTSPSATAPFGPAVAVATVTTQASLENSPRALTLAADDAGNAMLAWLDGSFDPPTRVAAARFTAGAGWGVPATVYRASGASTYQGPRVAMDPAGNAVVVFSLAPSSSQFEVRAARFTAR